MAGRIGVKLKVEFLFCMLAIFSFFIVFNFRRNEVGASLCFYTCLWFCSWGGGIPVCLACLQIHTQGGSWGVWPGGCLQAHTQGGSWGVWLGSLQAHTQEEGGLQAHTWAVFRPTPWGMVSQHGLRQTPPRRQLLLRAVRILECILVFIASFVHKNLVSK